MFSYIVSPRAWILSQTPRFRKFCFALSGMGFPVRTKGTGNTEHMFSQWGLVGTGNREQGTGNKSLVFTVALWDRSTTGLRQEIFYFNILPQVYSNMLTACPIYLFCSSSSNGLSNYYVDNQKGLCPDGSYPSVGRSKVCSSLSGKTKESQYKNDLVNQFRWSFWTTQFQRCVSHKELWEGIRDSHSHNSNRVMGIGGDTGIFLWKKTCALAQKQFCPHVRQPRLPPRLVRYFFRWLQCYNRFPTSSSGQVPYFRCVSLFVFMYVWVHVYIYRYVCIHMFIWIYVLIYILIYIYCENWLDW